MKLIHKNVDKDGRGYVYQTYITGLCTFRLIFPQSSMKYKRGNRIFRSVTLMPDESEDMWHAYNLISEGDCVRASTIRSGHMLRITSYAPYSLG
jgi:hypothetical protein